jgi:hypothetical protein
MNFNFNLLGGDKSNKANDKLESSAAANKLSLL